MFDFMPSERTSLALERIARALECLAGLNERDTSPRDTSAILYTDDLADLQKELKREAYEQRTGVHLAWDEEPPAVPSGEEDVEDA